MRRAVLAAAVVALVLGCTTRSVYVPPRNDLARAVAFTEYDKRRESPYPISVPDTGKKTDDPAPVDRVPQPALVDWKSLIHIDIRKQYLIERFGSSERGDLFADVAGGAAAQESRKDDLVKALQVAVAWLEVRQVAIRTYRSGDLDAFQKARREAALKEDEILAGLAELYVGTELEGAMEEALNDPATDLPPFLQAQIDRIEEEDRSVSSRSRDRRVTLRLEAFLRAQEKEPAAIHLEGYDSLNEGRVHLRDQWGLALTPEETERLRAQMEKSKAISDAANAVLYEEKSLEEAMRETLRVVSKELADRVEEAEQLVDRIPERIGKIRAGFGKVAAEVEARAGDAGEAALAELRKAPDRLEARLGEESAVYVELVNAVAEGRELADSWRRARPEDLTSLVTRSTELSGKIRTLVDRLDELGRDAAAATKAVVEETTEALVDELRSRVADVLETEAAREFETEIRGLVADLKLARELAEWVAGKLKAAGKLRPLPPGTRVPEAFDVELGDLEPTYIDLTRTKRNPGDLVSVRATLSRGDKEPMISEATFEVTRFGWFATLSPGVVLAVPESDTGAVVFAPTLSWNHHYRPRPERTGFFPGLTRFLEPGVGIHAAFLSFPDIEETVQVGLGATLTFWKDRLQFGAGYNLMADDREEGRFYFFVGSDLIGLLQATGMVK